MPHDGGGSQIRRGQTIAREGCVTGSTYSSSLCRSFRVDIVDLARPGNRCPRWKMLPLMLPDGVGDEETGHAGDATEA